MMFVAGCGQKSTVTKLSPFSVTNKEVNGELMQVLEMTNGISFYFTESNVVVWFCKGSDTVIKYDPETLKPLTILLEIPPSGDRPGQSIFDLNADGIPDIMEVKETPKTRKIFYRGEWYTRNKEGTNIFITVNGKQQRVYFDGQRWVEISTKSDN
jgi:uncharacterized protein YneR